MTDAAPAAPTGRSRGAVWSWLALGVVVALVGTLVLVKVVGGSSEPSAPTTHTQTSSVVLGQLTSIPSSVYDQIGVASVSVPIVMPIVLGGAHPLLFTGSNGARLPGIVFLGTEYCSFCAAERWPLIAALSRFGTFSTLYNMDSTATDFAPSTPSFTFYGSQYKSRLVVFRPYEVRSDVPSAHGYAALMSLPSRERRIVRAFDATMQYPFVDIGNVVIVRQAAFSPETLAGATRDSIAGALSDPASPLTQAIVSSANVLTASICAADGERPTRVCTSEGVKAADAALHLAA